MLFTGRGDWLIQPILKPGARGGGDRRGKGGRRSGMWGKEGRGRGRGREKGRKGGREGEREGKEGERKRVGKGGNGEEGEMMY